MSNGIYTKLQQARAEIKRLVTSQQLPAEGIATAFVVVEITTRYPMSKQQVMNFLKDLTLAGLVRIEQDMVIPCSQ